MKGLSLMVFVAFIVEVIFALEKEQAVTDCISELSIDEGKEIFYFEKVVSYSYFIRR